jgi:VanZ family protein
VGRVITRTVAFGFGYLATLLLVCGLNIVYRGIWLPAGLAGVLGYLLAFLPRFRDGALRLYAAALFGSVATVLWMATTKMLPVSRNAELTRLILPLFGFVALGLVVSLIVEFRKIPATTRPALGWLFALFTVGWIVAFFSSAKGGADPMIAWVQSVLHLSADQAETFVVVLRKAIHITFYAAAGLAAWRLARGSGAPPDRSTVFALSAPLATAIFDEVRQSTIAGRTGSVWDVLLDMVGVAVVVLIWRSKDRAPQVQSGGPRPASF